MHRTHADTALLQPRPHPLSTLRLKISKTTVVVPITDSTTLSALRKSLLSALTATSAGATADDPELPALPASADDIALWRLEAPERDADGAESEKWVRLRDEKSGADHWGVSEGEELGVSFKAADGSYPPPTVIRPVDDDEFE